MLWTRRLPAPLWKIALGGVPAVGLLSWGVQVYMHTRIPDSAQIQQFMDIPDSFRKSPTIDKIVNARRHQAPGDSLCVTIELPPQHKDVSDEQLLAKFVQGYFGGSVISLERSVLRILGRNLTLPPLHSVLYGVFQVLDVQLESSQSSLSSGTPTESFIDFGFGSNQFIFAGAHRFSVVRSAEKSANGRELVQIHCYSTSCNPTEDKPLGPGFMYTFHAIYNSFLFREGVAMVLSFTHES
ncbi:hypothetical protein BGZ63DRAFT_358057 [Mariannaea sp. PMI_226]|nr:hypothetical protein BGZ63DRAFT_358057 [Mariannaea sp. PMI_226]